MNYKILNKVLDELNKEAPDISYLRGMIETLLSLEDKPSTLPGSSGTVSIPYVSTPYVPAETTPVAGLGRTPQLAGIKDFIDKSVKTE